MFCGKCGTEIPEGYEFCMKCGTKVENTSIENQDVQKLKKSKKWIILVIAMIVIVIIAVGARYFVNDAKKKSGLYNDMQWGMSYEEVLAQLEERQEGTGELLLDEEGKTILDIVSDYGDDIGVEAFILYNCEKGTLQEISILMLLENSDFTNEMIIDKYEKKFNSLYGECEDKSYEKIWYTDESKIKLMYIDNLVTAIYTDIDIAE